MDWFVWLSKTGLDPALVYQYGLEFTRNELQAEDLPHFDHEFLQSMGISIAKHRLEILKVARKDASRLGKRLSVLMAAINKTKRSVGKYFERLVSAEEETAKDPPEPADRARENRRVALTRKYGGDKEFKDKPRTLALSGPLDGMFQKKCIAPAHKNPKLSGPLLPSSKNSTWSGALDVKSHENAILALQSMNSTGPLDGGWMVTRSSKLSQSVEGRPVTVRDVKLSGPLDRAMNRSPRVSARAGPGRLSSHRVHVNGNLDVGRMKDGFDEHPLWAKLFHDMKPT